MKRESFFGSSPLFASFGREILTALGGIASVVLSFAILTLLSKLLGVESLVALGPFGMIAAVLVGWIPSRIHVGDDGVLWQWLFWKRFVRIADVREATTFHNGVELTLRSGEKVRLASSVFRMLMLSFQTEKRDKLLAAIQRAVEAQRAHHVTEAASLVARAGRSAKDWIDALRALVSSDGGYRSPMLTRDVLWRIAEDASVDETARAGAAYALRKDLSVEERVRLKDIAGGAASPKVRVALEAETDETAEEALRAFES